MSVPLQNFSLDFILDFILNFILDFILDFIGLCRAVPLCAVAVPTRPGSLRRVPVGPAHQQSLHAI